MPDQVQVTDRQRQLLLEIRKFIQLKGFPPTHREIREALGVASTNTVVCLLEPLVTKGLLHITPNVSRGLRITVQGNQLLGEEA